MAKQVTLPHVSIDVQKAPDGETTLLVLTEIEAGNVAGDVYVVPMPNAIAEQIGTKLRAPGITIAPASALVMP
jgi:hypothetical protein